MKFELLFDAKAALAEGPFWHATEQRLYWVDIPAGRLHALDPNTGNDVTYDAGRLLGCAVPCDDGQWLLAGKGGITRFDPASGTQTPLADPEPDLSENRCNDGKCDARGRFWIGTYNMLRRPKAAALYCLESGKLRRVLEGVTTSNGLGWSPDQRTMYYIDTPTLMVAAFDFDLERGTLAKRRGAVQFSPGVGRPDGMCVDAEGMLWVAHWDGGRISRWDPRNGRLLAEVSLPAARVSSCAFGGPRLDRLYVTTARHGLTAEQVAEQPHAGGLFVIEPGVPGLPVGGYKGV
jgi:sugar lactone lactonase YvrE